MWTKPQEQTIGAAARPLRVAYLIDIDDCPDELLDAIFAEAYSRWGGRRTLIVPATNDGIDRKYSDWLFYFDADVAYSFVALSDPAILAFHERYAPAHLVYHREWQRDSSAERSFKIELPLPGLSSLSVLPAFLSRSWGFDGPPRNVKILSKYWDQSESQFLQENFGFLSSSFSNGAISSAHPTLYSTLTLITDAALSNGRLGKEPNAAYVTSESEVLSAFGETGGPIALAQIADFFAPYLISSDGMNPEGTYIIVGDTPSDRLLFWNIYQRFEQQRSFSEIMALRLPVAKANDDGFLKHIRQILRRRGARGPDGLTDRVCLLSCSVERQALDAIADRLKQGETWLGVTIEQHLDHAGIVPLFKNSAGTQYSFGGLYSAPEGRGSAEFDGKRAPVPLVLPWHMKEALPPAELRYGNWMLDISIDRAIDHCRYANKRHDWRLPRRLRLERSFDYVREGARVPGLGDKFIRVMRSGILGLATNVEVTRASITAPDDIEAMRMGVCNNLEWAPFVSGRKDAIQGRARFVAAEVSDKGRYLLGMLQLFERLPDAFSVLMCGYWRDVLYHLGGVSGDNDEIKCREFLKVLRRRTGQRNGPPTFENEDELNRLSSEALRLGRMAAREKRYIRYDDLEERWRAVVEQYVKDYPVLSGDDSDDRIRDVLYLERSIQHLCQHEVLFQGREWRCRSCYNRNWVGIDEVRRTLTCSICGREEPAPVSGDWQFRANPFVLEAYRDHGIEAVIWSLWRLADRSKYSFFFAPSLKLWLSYPKSLKDDCDAEVDAVAVVDGKVYLVEAKSSGGLSETQIKQLILAAERIRPDVLLVASMDKSNKALDKSIAKLRTTLPIEIELEILAFSPDQFDRSPFLPC